MIKNVQQTQKKGAQTDNYDNQKILDGRARKVERRREMAGEIAAPTCCLWRSQLQMNIWVESAVKATKEREREREICKVISFAVFNRNTNKVAFKRNVLKGI